MPSIEFEQKLTQFVEYTIPNSETGIGGFPYKLRHLDFDPEAGDLYIDHLEELYDAMTPEDEVFALRRLFGEKQFVQMNINACINRGAEAEMCRSYMRYISHLIDKFPQKFVKMEKIHYWCPERPVRWVERRTSG